MSLLRDQGFEVGDEVILVHSPLRVEHGEVVHIRENIPQEEVLIKRAPLEHLTGNHKGRVFGNRPSPLYFFHRDAVTFDAHGRLASIDHDYVKPRPKTVTRLDYDFQPFEQILLRDNDDQPWRKDLFDKRTDAHKPYVGLVLGKGWSQCIPFVGNEKLDGKVTR